MSLNLPGAFLLALSLCADCFAISACSSVTLRKVGFRPAGLTALVFALVQSGFFVIGWGLGDAVAGIVERAAHIVAFLILLYVGGSMFLEGILRREETRNLEGFRNVLAGAAATSIDALAVGASFSMNGEPPASMAVKAAAILAVTFATVVLGILGGAAVGRRFGFLAEIAGGLVLIAIGMTLLFV